MRLAANPQRSRRPDREANDERRVRCRQRVRSAPTTTRRAESGERAPAECDRQRPLVWAPIRRTGGEPSAGPGCRPCSAVEAVREHRVPNLHRTHVRARAWSAAGKVPSGPDQIAEHGWPPDEEGEQHHCQQPSTRAPQGAPNQNGDVSGEQRRVHGRHVANQEPPTDRRGADRHSGEHQRQREVDSPVQDGFNQVRSTIAGLPRGWILGYALQQPEVPNRSTSRCA